MIIRLRWLGSFLSAICTLNCSIIAQTIYFCAFFNETIIPTKIIRSIRAQRLWYFRNRMRLQPELKAPIQKILTLLKFNHLFMNLYPPKQLVLQQFIRTLEFLLGMPTKSSILLSYRQINQTLYVVSHISFINYDLASCPTSRTIAIFLRIDHERYKGLICDIIIRLHYTPPYFHIIWHLL